MSPSGNRRPNIVLIMSDDLGYEAIGANGGTSYATPVLDGMAGAGIRFENAHVQPLCTPTRVQLMTGKYNFRNYIGFGLIAPDEVTFGHLFSSAGYKTCIAGKWQLHSYNPPDEMPEARSTGQKIEDAGFDEFCVWHPHHTEEKGSRYKSPIVYENGEFLENMEGKYGEDVFADYIIDFMERNRDDPFFVYFPMALTHRPLEPTPDSPEFDDFVPPSNETLGARTWAKLEDWDDEARYYKDMVEYHDKVIGRVNAKLEQLGIAEDTLVIYVGDNGSPVEVCSIIHSHTEVCGGKGLTVDRGTHVPLICSWPGTIPSGAVTTDLIDASDFLPTILEAAEITPPDDYFIDGRSFLPQLKGETGNPRDWIFFHFEPMSGRVHRYARFIRDHRWKLYDDGRLFDLNADPEEEAAFDPADDDGERSEARSRLAPVFEQMIK
ncbi:MAG: sulfatase-like hydrolase/transferase [Dehalococcoidia bacterium]|jgi:arylsulfatase A-like enzyme|nr:sulfatase-like hydrolase/transferase [Dehalococcoidia bacterium]HIN14816.1 arylsulfatase A [Dehalococcoidia bacterium]|tara:strand:- start:327 stop:1634 length:1308 start_codon:yes stop_codon:yes gene_type:complete